MVREAYFDAPNLGRLIQDVWNNPLCVTGRIKAVPPGMWRWIVIYRTAKTYLKR